MRGAWLAGLVLGVAAQAGAAEFDRLFVFGDSLSDTGRVDELTLGREPGPLYYDGRFSNGPLWVEGLAPLVGAPYRQGLNFAYAGAETSGISQVGVPGVLGQIGQFVLNRPAGRSGGLYAVWAGGNDYLRQVQAGTDLAPVVERTVANLERAVSRLARLGGRTFVLPNLPDLGDVPDVRGSERAAALTAATDAHNARLARAAESLARQLGVKIVVADVNALFRQVRAEPGQYGFINTREPCLRDGTPTGACATQAAADASVFWDELHPTAAAHRLIAEFVNGTLMALNDAAETVAVQSQLALHTAAGWHRALLAGRRAAVPGPGGRTAFLVGGAAWGRQDGQAAQVGYRYDTQAAGVGAELPVGEAVRVGVSIGHTQGSAELSGDAGSLDLTSTVVGVHAVAEHGGWHLAAAGSYAFDRYGGVIRRTGFAPLPQASAETDGRTLGVSVEGGYTAALGAVTLTPSVGLRFTHVRIDGYRESGAGVLSLSVQDQHARSLVGRVGAEASTRLTLGRATVVPRLSLAWEHEFADDARPVTVFFPDGRRNRVSPDADWRDALVVGVGVSATLLPALSAALGYEAHLRAGGHEHTVSARLQARF